MDVRLQITGGDVDDLVSLTEWLSDERDLRGAVRRTPAPIGSTELGAYTDLLTVALGAGGGATLARSLNTWLKTRRTSAKLTIKSGKHSVTIDISSVRDVRPLLEQVLRDGDDDE